MKCLVIGDTHFDNVYKGYLENQLASCLRIVNEIKPKIVVFLGDVYHHRKPSPEVLVAVHKLFQRLAVVPGLTNIYVIRGNHDSSNKSDNGLTALETLVYPGSKVSLIAQTSSLLEENFVFVPHYEDEDKVSEALSSVKDKESIAFGHFAYKGCINTGPYFDFKVKREEFKNRTILGHLHKYSEDGDVTILGTPWSTNFSEGEYDHYVGVLERTNKTWGPLKKVKVDFGPRHYVAPYEALDAMQEDITDDRFFMLLRVVIDKFTDEDLRALKLELLDRFKVGHIEFKFQPVYDKVLNNRLSNYDPNSAVNLIGEDIINKYVEEQASTIPREKLEEGLNLIKEHENPED